MIRIENYTPGIIILEDLTVVNTQGRNIKDETVLFDCYKKLYGGYDTCGKLLYFFHNPVENYCGNCGKLIRQHCEILIVLGVYYLPSPPAL